MKGKQIMEKIEIAIGTEEKGVDKMKSQPADS